MKFTLVSLFFLCLSGVALAHSNHDQSNDEPVNRFFDCSLNLKENGKNILTRHFDSETASSVGSAEIIDEWSANLFGEVESFTFAFFSNDYLYIKTESQLFSFLTVAVNNNPSGEIGVQIPGLYYKKNGKIIQLHGSCRYSAVE